MGVSLPAVECFGFSLKPRGWDRKATITAKPYISHITSTSKESPPAFRRRLAPNQGQRSVNPGRLTTKYVMRELQNECFDIYGAHCKRQETWQHCGSDDHRHLSGCGLQDGNSDKCQVLPDLITALISASDFQVQYTLRVLEAYKPACFIRETTPLRVARCGNASLLSD